MSLAQKLGIIDALIILAFFSPVILCFMLKYIQKLGWQAITVRNNSICGVSLLLSIGAWVIIGTICVNWAISRSASGEMLELLIASIVIIASSILVHVPILKNAWSVLDMIIMTERPLYYEEHLTELLKPAPVDVPK